MHILVLNHNGRELLDQCFPSVLDCARTARLPCRVTVVDNASSDGSAQWVRQRWPEAGLICLPNRGLVSFNEAALRVDEPILLLLNNDVWLTPGCIDRLASAFDLHSDCFLAGPLCRTRAGGYEGTRSHLCFRRGLVHTRLAPAARADRPGYTASAGAALAVRRDRFLALGGFDPLFLPGRYEDLDLAFRGWLRGWKAHYVPDALVYHAGRGTYGRLLSEAASRELDLRNALLFAWKNLREPRHLALHGAFLAMRLLLALIGLERSVLRSAAAALRRLPQALAGGRTANRHILERELFALLGD